jgi:RND superfamily putative drug exporter
MSAAAKAEPSYQSAYQSLDDAQSKLSVQNSGSLKDVLFKYNAISDALGLGISQANDAERGAAKLNSAVGQLSGGINTVAKHTGELTSGLGQLSSGSGQLSNGLIPLRNGASALSSGLSKLGSGSGQLGSGLASGYTNSRPLASGLHKLRSSVARMRGSSSGPVNLKAVSKSAYLTMALLSAAPPAQKQNLRMVLNEQNGGSAARIYLITKQFPTNKTLAPFAARLNLDSQRLARQIDATVAVGGPGQTFLDYDRFTHSRILPLIAVLSLVSFLFLLMVFRSVLLAAKAVVLNMITVGAAMGAINLLYGGDNPAFGGPGWMEATSFFVVYSTTFALSMDYEIFMINRMRETYLQTGSNEQAIRDGVTKTAGIVTGSAAVMTVLFLAVAFTSELISNAQMGLGLAVAITIDATVVRLILLPASMRLFGDANWWLPAWLDRWVPNVAIH